MSTVLRGLSPLESYRELTDFARRCGENALRLAMHAAVPQSFRPELLHLLKLNFLPEAVRDLAVEADVLLAPFTENLSGGYYQFDSETRRQLLDHLDAAHPQRNGSRLQQVARFLAGYVNREEEKLEASADPLRRDFLEIQRWVALAYIDPDSAARQLAYALDHSSENERGAVRLQIGGLIRSLSTPLSAHPELLIYAAGLRSLEEGRFQEGRQLLERLGSAEVQVAGLKLRSVDAVITEWRSRLKTPEEETGRQQTEAESILIFTEAGAAGWSSEPLYQRWKETGFRVEFMNASDVEFGGPKKAQEFVSAHRVAFLILDEADLALNHGPVSSIFGLPSLPVIPVSLPRLDQSAAHEQYPWNPLDFGWWANPIKMDRDKNVSALAEQVHTAVATIRRWAQAPENALELTRQQAAFSRQYGTGPGDELRALVEVQVQNSRSEAHELLERKDLAGARILLEQALAAYKEVQRAETLVKAELLADLAGVLTTQGELQRAIELLNDALAGAHRFDSKHLQISALLNLGNIYLVLHQSENGRAFLEQALVLSEKTADPRSAKIRDVLAEAATKESSAAGPRAEELPPRDSSSQATPGFISYAREDSDFALRLAKDLKANGVRVWLDQLDIRPPRSWDFEVETALKASSEFLVILSPAAVNSDHVRDEVSFAINENKTVIPVMYRDCQIPFRLIRLQYADFRTDYRSALQVLLRWLGQPSLQQLSAVPPSANEMPPVESALRLTLQNRPPPATAQPKPKSSSIFEKVKGFFTSESEEASPVSSPSDAIGCKVFINYRRDDSSAWAGRLYDNLRTHLGPGGEIVTEIDSLTPGTDFDQAIEKTIGSCQVVLVVMGPRWGSVSDDLGRPRISDPTDFVATEIRIALERGLVVIPILVGGATLPSLSYLPYPLARLATLQSASLSDKNWQGDVYLLVQTIARVPVNRSKPPFAN